METIFADRISDVPKSFIREILKVTAEPEIISFAGGLPNRDFFPVEQIKTACNEVLDTDGMEALQYSTTEGHNLLRKYISDRYKTKKNLDVSSENIIITNGSQQGLDLLGKVLINENDSILLEKPGYLGAIQSFSLYKPDFNHITLKPNGIDTDELRNVLKIKSPKLFYTVPNFQNPTGVTYDLETRKETGRIIEKTNCFLIEDDPYGELRFKGSNLPSFKEIIPDNTILLGSFSKIFAPSFRLGWIATDNKELYEKLIVAKQASDLHTNYFSQKVLYQYLLKNDIDSHIERICKVYGEQRDSMVNSLKRYFGNKITITEPEGGMFLWVTLPENINSMELFQAAIKKNVAFVPGTPFYASNPETNTLRLNFTNSSPKIIEEGVKRLYEAFLNFSE